jgi:hypothetical protein
MTKIPFGGLLLTLFCFACSSAPKDPAPPAESKEAPAEPSLPADPADTAREAKKAAAAESVSAANPNANSELVNEVICEKGEESRKLTVVMKGDGCELQYTKGGHTTSAATSVAGSEHCVKAQEKVSQRLTAAGYRCM